ncbi:MAG TPA: hypothetical protein VF665_06140 [Longimicrobium sp.]|jgi:drug/metabolite transporter (DMT)-like permease|uniref:hypothetical protein n=1 Tax=Longimicrobium sp. TaxID=2029185 RepID=UPI002ED93327
MLTRFERIVRWFLFSVLVSLMPLLISYAAMRLENIQAPGIRVTADGGLLLICTTVAAGALGELIPSGRGRALEKITAAGGCILVVMFGTLYYAAVKSSAAPNTRMIFTTSLLLLAGAISAGLSCLYLSQEGLADAA